MHLMMAMLFMLASIAAEATPDAVVEAVQMPVWLQRGEHTMPLRVGTELRNGDRLFTGEHARLYLTTADGSTVKLGEKASLRLDGLAQNQQDSQTFRAVLNVVKGAFRFTTGALNKLRSRDVTVRVAGATIGIRGTDVWGKDGDEQGVVCLIEGRIEVLGPDQKPFVMDQPRSFYRMPRDGTPPPVAPVDPEQLNKWAAETELSAPAAQRGGKWKVTLLTTTDQTSALAAYDQWREAGYDVRIFPTVREGGHDYQLRLIGLPDRTSAERLAAQLRGQMGANHPVASR
ncbi:MAG: hypothetical protein Fur0040_03570 [Sideroxydans sp.]